MTKILLGLLATFLLIGCSSDAVEQNVEPKLVVGQSIADLKLNDQFEKPHTLNSNTYKLIFAFSKDSAHICNDFFNTKAPTYIEDHNAQFVADVSAAPSLIRKVFIMPGLKDLKHSVSIIEDKVIAAEYIKEAHIEELMVVDVDNFIIKNISYVSTEPNLAKLFQ